MKKILLIIGILLVNGLVNGQNIIVQQDSKTTELINEHKKANAKIGAIQGFRIQIFFDSGNNSKTNAEQVKSKFLAQHPEVVAYLTFKEPNFRVRVGDFRTRNEARGFLKKIINEYQNAFVIKDEIKYPPLTQVEIEKNTE
ncbi:MAG: SPOR domain-containing protein [Bacteroidota bacterium]